MSRMTGRMSISMLPMTNSQVPVVIRASEKNMKLPMRNHTPMSTSLAMLMT